MERIIVIEDLIKILEEEGISKKDIERIARRIFNAL